MEKDIADELRGMNISGIKIDDGYKRFYPYGELASKVLGFTGGDNQGIIGLEVVYDSILQGKNTEILNFSTCFSQDCFSLLTNHPYAIQ